ncbi:MAG: FAD-dependent 5-carboxymethylaminomethyl-2-thiouridine(34) oxidoreductase MnmC [Gallionellaceae bacterium]|jgi:tRNA 5-methylaminomethyl-2-thiouridine biosynthesis bifunctional protein
MSIDHPIGKKTTPSTALIIGAGIAGCAAAHALAQRGISVTLVDRAETLAGGASGNPRGILYARFTAANQALQHFVLAAYRHALALLDDVLPVDGINRAECGLLQLACNAAEVKRMANLARQSWPGQFMQFVDAEQASQLAGIPMKFGGLWFPSGGWVVPSKWCEKMISDKHIVTRLGHDVDRLEKIESGWSVSGFKENGEVWSTEAEVVLVCNAYSAKKLAQFARFPLMPVRGQITEPASTAASEELLIVVCGEGYCAPAAAGVHVIGATHAFNDESIEVRSIDHNENLAKLSTYSPALFQAIRGESSTKELSGRAATRCSAPGSMPLVGKVQDGLYCSLAHGTRGLLSAGLSAEVLAAQICGQLAPLHAEIIDALAPLPRVRNKG